MASKHKCNKHKFNRREHYKVPEAASVAGVTRKTIREWCYKGELPGSFQIFTQKTKTHGRWAIPKSVLMDKVEAYNSEKTNIYMGHRYPHQLYITWLMIQTRFSYPLVKDKLRKLGLSCLPAKDFNNFKSYLMALIKPSFPRVALAMRTDLSRILSLDSPEMVAVCEMLEVKDMLDDPDCIPWIVFRQPLARWHLDILLHRSINHDEIKEYMEGKFKIDLKVDEIETYRKYLYDVIGMTNENIEDYIYGLEFTEEQTVKSQYLTCSLNTLRVEFGLDDSEDDEGEIKYALRRAVQALDEYYNVNKGNLDLRDIKAGSQTIMALQKHLKEVLSSDTAPGQAVADAYKDMAEEYEIDDNLDAIPIDKLEEDIVRGKNFDDNGEDEVKDGSAS